MCNTSYRKTWLPRYRFVGNAVLKINLKKKLHRVRVTGDFMWFSFEIVHETSSDFQRRYGVGWALGMPPSTRETYYCSVFHIWSNVWNHMSTIALFIFIKKKRKNAQFIAFESIFLKAITHRTLSSQMYHNSQFKNLF